MSSAIEITGPTVCASAECEQVMRSLPAWFGVEHALRQYARDTTRLPTFVAHDAASQVTGFITLHHHFIHAWEIHCIAVHARRRRQGLGRALLRHAERWAVDRGAVLMQVKTIADSHPSVEYEQTRQFYRRCGYMPLEVFPTLWRPEHPCLQMVKWIGTGTRHDSA